MAQTMRGVVFVKPKKLELRQVPVPQIGPEDILVKIKLATTCGTDLKTYKRGHHEIPEGKVFGHELAGEVVDVGKDVTKFKPGMRVIPHNSAPCGKCYYCKHGQGNLCDSILFNFGAFGEYSSIPGPIVDINTFEIPELCKYDDVVTLEPLSTVVHGQRLLQIQPGDSLALIGSGPIGLMHLQMALNSGVSKIIAVDISETRLKVAKEMGAQYIINASDVDPIAAIKELTDGMGTDVSIEATGAVAGWQSALKAARKGGKVLWFGGLKPEDRMDLEVHHIHYNETTIFNTHHSTPLDVHIAFELLTSGRINGNDLISMEMPLEKVEEALLKMDAGEVVKVAIKPDLS
jgi:L-iditol 2-dehydrogenase